MDKIKIREMKKKDIGQVVAIIKEINKRDAKLAEGCYRRHYHGMMKKSKYVKDFVIIFEGKIVGVSGFHKELTETVDIFWLNWTAIKKAFRGKGFGKLLIEKIKKDVKRLGGRKLYVEASTEPGYIEAVKFYRKLGFKKEAKLKDYYAKGVNSLIFGMVL